MGAALNLLCPSASGGAGAGRCRFRCREKDYRWPAAAEAHPVCCARCSCCIQSKSFRLPAAAESLFSCVAKRKVTKREGHPAWRLPGILSGKSVSRGRAFRQGILPWRKGTDIPVGSRCAACRPRLTAAQGPRVEQRAILARTFQRSQGNSRRRRMWQRYSSQGRKHKRAVPDRLLSTRSEPSLVDFRCELRQARLAA